MSLVTSSREAVYLFSNGVRAWNRSRVAGRVT
jgi:hypothetical protein